MSDRTRQVSLERLSKGRYRARNKHGDTLVVGEGSDGTFTPVELLLTAIAACSAIDVDYIVGKRAEPEWFRLLAEADKVRDDGGNHLTGIRVVFDAKFEATDAGTAARDVFPRAIAQSHDRLCTVTRTVILGSEVESVIGQVPGETPGR